ncbi:MAG: CYTH domain-containing protein [Pseudomonadota bacterium]|nr:CYTH domain-containing protein [Pseudomonadota bacterium]
MAVEIERKFLLSGGHWRQDAGQAQLIRQGYLSDQPDRTVRVRVLGDQGWLTIKGRTQGIARAEFEYPIPLADAMQLLDQLCLQPLIEKQRYRIQYADLVWEVDEFFGQNTGLVVAEIELSSADQVFARPDWLGQEVSDDPRYFNSALIARPYSTWSHAD